MRINDTLPDLHKLGNWYQGRAKRNLLGSPTLIVFWSVSCDSCEIIMRQLTKLQQSHTEMQTILIHTPLSNEDNHMQKIREKASHFSIDGAHVADLDEDLSDLFRVRYVPALYLFDQQGQLRYSQAGKSNVSMLERKIARLYT